MSCNLCLLCDADAVQTFLEKLGDLENVGVNQRHIGFLRDVFEDPSLLYLTNVSDFYAFHKPNAFNTYSMFSNEHFISVPLCI